MKYMNTKTPGYKFAIGYLIIFLLFVLYAVVMAAQTPFAGLPLILLTYPWSMMSISWLDSIGYIMWYDQFAANGNWIAYFFFSNIVYLPGALINAFILYLMGFGAFTEKDLEQLKKK